MVPSDIGFQDFSRTGIRYVWSVCVLNVRSKVADHRIAGIFWTPGRIFCWGWSFLGNNRIFETCCFKTFLPIFYALLQVRNPFGRGSWIDVVHDRLYRLYQFTTGKLLSVLWLYFQSPTIKVSSRSSALLVGTVVYIRTGKPAYTLISKSLLHRHLWKEDHGGIHLQSNQACYTVGRRLSCCIGKHIARLNVDWVAIDVLDVRALVV